MANSRGKNKKAKKDKNPQVHSDLEGFEIKINSFGEIKSNLEIDKINEFLNEEVEDKKLINRNEKDAPGKKDSKRKRKE